MSKDYEQGDRTWPPDASEDDELETAATNASAVPGEADPTVGAKRTHHRIKIVPEPGDSSALPGDQREIAPGGTPSTQNSPDTGSSATPGGTPPRREPETIKITNPDLRKQEVVRGSHPGDRYVRYDRNVETFRRKGRGHLEASLETMAPRGRYGRFFGKIKRALIGNPISSEHSMHERLTNVKALAVLSSDALSSVAYATEEVLRILVLAGVAALTWALPLGLAIIVLMVIVIASYRQTIAAYPRGGGTYIVAKDNLGTLAGLTAASSILIGYILTVAVSVAAGVAALYSLYPSVREYRVEICMGMVVFITIANLRGLREAGNIFAVPTYLFILGIIAMIVYGLLRLFLGVGGDMVYTPPATTLLDTVVPGAEGLSILLLLRAFTQGSAALTGVEAIADGVPAFKPPEAKNARSTLLYMGIVAIAMFAGITYLATYLKILPSEDETVVSQIARTIFGSNAVWYFIQIVTSMILVLAANTAFADFPRLSYFLARDKFMPHQYSFRGDRLAYSWGIVTLAALACILLVAFNGETSALIPLYAIGVMSAFTFSQSGMVVRWWRTRPPGWQRNLVLNAVGATVTALVFLTATLTKLDKGTWLVLILVPVLIVMFLAINRHYRRLADEVSAAVIPRRREFKHTFIVPVSNLNAVSLEALDYARSLSANVTAVHIAEGEDEEESVEFNKKWRETMEPTDINLVIIESPYRSLIAPLLYYIDALDRQVADDTITIVLPEFLPAKPWEYLLHNQSALRLKAALLFRPNTVVADVPYQLGRNLGPLAKRAQSGWRNVPWGPIRAFVFLLVLGLIYYFFFLSR
ncbi:MAG: APC family permease [Chloroflexota bacterium]